MNLEATALDAAEWVAVLERMMCKSNKLAIDAGERMRRCVAAVKRLTNKQ